MSSEPHGALAPAAPDAARPRRPAAPGTPDASRRGGPLRRSLRARIALALSVTTTAILLLCGWFFFVHARGLLVDRTSETLLGVASIVAGDLPTDGLEAYLATERAGNPDLAARGLFLARLRDVADRAGVDDLYLVDRSNRVLLDAARRLPFGEEDFGLSLAHRALDRAWSDRAAIAAPLFSRPDRGYRLAAFAPVLTPDGRTLALVGAERSLPGLAVNDALRDRFLWIFAGGVLLSLGAAALVSATILRPVERLVRGIAVSDASGYPPAVPEGNADEIGFLTREFNRLIGDLRGKDAALRELYGREKARADLVLAGVPTGVVGLDAEGVVRLWNPAAAAILGLPEERALERGLAELPLPPALRAALDAALAGSPPPSAESAWRGPSGQKRLEIAAVPYRGPDGAALGAVALVSDVTERARLEEELRIRERLAALGEMSAGIAHEVRNPLTAMEGFAGLLARRLRDPAELELLQGLRREIDALNAIVTAFSRFARSPRLSRRAVELRSLLEELLPYFERVPADGAPLEFDLELDGVPPLDADPDEIRTAFANLLRNAAEAQPQGGEVRVRATFDAARRMHVVRVSDRGPGVPPELAARVFDPFFSTKGQGTGMGLALVHRIVAAHGGTVRLLQGAGAGATFELELPLRPETGADPAETGADRPASGTARAAGSGEGAAGEGGRDPVGTAREALHQSRDERSAGGGGDGWPTS